jgi:hypothetical protein
VELKLMAASGGSKAELRPNIVEGADSLSNNKNKLFLQ